MIDLPNLWGASLWTIVPAVGAGVLLLAAVVWSYLRPEAPAWVRGLCVLAKVAAVALLVMILLEPLKSERRPRPGANLFVILADDSQSLQIRDPGQSETRAEQLKQRLERQSAWQVRLNQDFDVRRYVFDRRVRPVADFAAFAAEGNGSALAGSLKTVADRYQGRPSAGVLLLTDGNATDLGDGSLDFSELPPVYPVVLGDDDSAQDISITRISVSQTNFEAAPVSIAAEVTCHGYAGSKVVVELQSEAGEMLQRQVVSEVEDDKPFAIRFQVRPQVHGMLFYRVRTYAEGTEKQFEPGAATAEATLVNNTRLAAVDRGGGPYRVLYVTGRPNWEFKFLRRSLTEDDEVNLVGLVRIAKREPRFQFREKSGEANPLFKGFSERTEEQEERYDEPVLVRLGTTDQEELRGGFPKAADQLFKYDAIVLDDVEAEFFNQDQQSLLQEFVSKRGGGLLMLGGQESFVKGGYARTPIGELLPVYVETFKADSTAEQYKLALTREGWLQPWVRVRSTEPEEKKRLETMPPFKTVNRVNSIKPGASVLAHVKTDDGATYPGLVVQNFGKGRTAALLVGDLWRWQLHREKPEDDDLEKSWRQTIRWLVADVPRRVQVEVNRLDQDPNQPVEIGVRVFDEAYKPLDNATVAVKIATPEGKKLELTAEAVDATSGVYKTTYVPRVAGAYRAEVVVAALDGSEIGRRESGWVSEPAADEFTRLRPNRGLLERIARDTGGEVIGPERLGAFVSGLPNRKIPITEPRVYPYWHTWTIFLLVVGLLVGEWGLRRIKGLP